ncbi:Phospholipase A2 isozyme PA4 [Sarcoptes scabiei]|nr:Phospholipase A2 isozyme PA4 [Sarcoptes scabiei]
MLRSDSINITDGYSSQDLNMMMIVQPAQLITFQRPFEVLIQNDKTMAHLIFDKTGRDLYHCQLFDLEKEPSNIRLHPSLIGKRPMVVSHRTMLEALRRCTDLALQKHSNSTDQLPIVSSAEIIDGIHQINDENSPNGFAKTNSTIYNITSSTSIPLISETNGKKTAPPIATSTTPSMMNKFEKFDVNYFFTFWKGIVPGTKWCGLGDLASTYEDLGSKLDVDLCCRAHDHCPVRLKAFRMGYGIFNFSFYSRLDQFYFCINLLIAAFLFFTPISFSLHCDCDDDFFKCLKNSSSSYAAMLGNFYFNVLKIHCLKEDQYGVASIANNNNSSVPSTLLSVVPQLVCLKFKNQATQECLEQGLSSDSSFKMRIVPFGRHF